MLQALFRAVGAKTADIISQGEKHGKGGKFLLDDFQIAVYTWYRQLDMGLQGRVQSPTGGIVRERAGA